LRFIHFSNKSDRIKCYLVELIRVNYIYSSIDYNNINLKKNIIETLFLKHFSPIVFSLENLETLNLFSNLTIEICTLTNDIKFYDKLIRLLFILHNDYRFFSHESDRTKTIWNFQKTTIINLYNKLSDTFQSDKLILLNKKIYNSIKVKNDIPLLVIILNIFKNLVINKDFELFVSRDNPAYKSGLHPSQMVINFISSKHKKQKKVYENLKSKKVNIYEPYIAFKHNKIYDYLMVLINQDETNTFICEEVIDLLNTLLKTFFFYKGVRFEKLLTAIIEIDDIKKYSNRQRFIDLLIEILLNSASHFVKREHKGNISFTSGFAVGSPTNEVIELSDESYKERIILFSLNSLKSFIGILKNLITNYKKLVVLSLNFNSGTPNLVPASITVTQINFTNVLGNNIIYSNNKGININNITESFDYLITSKDTINIAPTGQNSLNLKTCIYYIKRLLFLLSTYMNTYISTNSGNEKAKKSLEFVTNVLETFYELKGILYFKISLAISILNFIFSIKDLLVQCGEETVIKIIFLILNIGWPNYENEILKTFTESFNIKLRKFELERIRISDKFMKREYVNLLSDTCCLYFVEKSSQGKTLFNAFNSIFKGKEMREVNFLELVKWNINLKTNRDNLKPEYRSKSIHNSQVYLGHK
jgi:hypothetical protein